MSPSERAGPLAHLNRFDLYELCVQDPPMEARFLAAAHGGHPRVLGEDFAGPGAIARAWVALSPDHRAILTDRDAEPLGHARARADRDPTTDPARLEYQQTDVISAGGRCDVIAALNFGVCELHTRNALLTYLRHALYRLEAGGVLVCDLYGGADAMTLGETRKPVHTDDGAIAYTWEQRAANPATARVVNAMHFTLPSGDTLRDAFVYDWRLWSTIELREAMREAGFRATEAHDSYGGAVDGEGNLYLEPIDADDRPAREVDDPDEPYVHYIVGRV